VNRFASHTRSRAAACALAAAPAENLSAIEKTPCAMP
jgi:hypothetical protein